MSLEINLEYQEQIRAMQSVPMLGSSRVTTTHFPADRVVHNAIDTRKLSTVW